MIMAIVGKIVWLITALASINIGSSTFFGFDALARVPAAWVTPVAAIIGLSGLISLFSCFQKCV